MTFTLYILAVWFLTSILGTLLFVWLLKTKRIGFEVAEDELAQFRHTWEPRK